MHAEHHPPDRTATTDHRSRVRSAISGRRRNAVGHITVSNASTPTITPTACPDGNDVEHAHTSAPAGLGRSAACFAISVTSPPSSTPITKNSGANCSREGHHDDHQRHQPEGRGSENRAEHVPPRHEPGTQRNTMAMQRIQRRRVHYGQPVPLLHIADPHRRVHRGDRHRRRDQPTAVMRGVTPLAVPPVTRHALSSIRRAPLLPYRSKTRLRRRHGGHLRRYGAVMAVFLRKLFGIGKLPEDLRAQVEAEEQVEFIHHRIRR